MNKNMDIDNKKYVYDIQSFYPYLNHNNYNEYQEKSLYHEHLVQIKKNMETKDIIKKLKALKLLKIIIKKINKIPRNHLDITDNECDDCYDNRNYYKSNLTESKKFSSNKINPNLFIIYKILSSIVSNNTNNYISKYDSKDMIEQPSDICDLKKFYNY
jgi:hypothetical protein